MACSGWRGRFGRELTERKAPDLAPASVAREMNLLKSVLRYARVDLEWIRVDPMADIRRPGGQRARDRRVPDDDLERMQLALGWVSDVPPENASQRIALMMLVAVETAMRSGELCSLAWDQVHAKYVRLDHFPPSRAFAFWSLIHANTRTGSIA